MKAADEKITQDVIWTALNALVFARSNPEIEKYYSILLFELANGNGSPITLNGSSYETSNEPATREFWDLVKHLKLVTSD